MAARSALLAIAVILASALPAAALDDFLCYRSRTATGTPKFTPRPGVGFVDRFGAQSITLFAYLQLCTPSDVNDGDPSAPSHPGHLAGYQTRNEVPHFARVHGLRVQNAFGEVVVDVTKPVRGLIPSAKSLDAPPPTATPTVDHFMCYKTRLSAGAPLFTPITAVTITDQLGNFTLDVKKPRALCVAAEKNGESPGAETHPDVLMCYAVKPSAGAAKFTPRAPVFIANQLGDATTTVLKPAELCVASTIVP
jgi:hypothetical protein